MAAFTTFVALTRPREGHADSPNSVSRPTRSSRVRVTKVVNAESLRK
jgi:hypothetical protein